MIISHFLTFIISHFLTIWVKYIAFPYGFLLKYRCGCVPKTGFSADILTGIFVDISVDISIDDFIDSLIGIFIDMLTDMFIDIFIDKEEGGEGGGGGVSFFFKSINPTPTGGEQKHSNTKNRLNDKCF